MTRPRREAKANNNCREQLLLGLSSHLTSRKWKITKKKEGNLLKSRICRFQSTTNTQAWSCMCPAGWRYYTTPINLCEASVGAHTAEFTAAGQQEHQRLRGGGGGGQSWVMSVLHPVWPENTLRPTDGAARGAAFSITWCFLSESLTPSCVCCFAHRNVLKKVNHSNGH